MVTTQQCGTCTYPHILDTLARDVKVNSFSVNSPFSSALLILTLSVAGLLHAQGGPCAGKFQRTPIEGVGRPIDLAVNNHRLVSSDGPTVSNWDLCDPDTPEFLGRWTLWNEGDITLNPMTVDERGFVYAAYGYGYDSSNPSFFSTRIWDARGEGEPTPASVIPGSLWDFIVDGDLLIGIGSGLVIYDVSDPFNPALVCSHCGDIDLDNSPPSYGGGNLRIAKLGDRAVILDFDELLEIDYFDPAWPTVVRTIPLSEAYGLSCRLWANDRVAALASNFSGSLQFVDLAGPATPTISSIAIDATGSNWGGFHNDVLIFQDDLGDRARRVDLFDPATPVELTPIDFEFWTDDGAIWDDRLYVGTRNGVQIYDLTDTPSLVGAGPLDRFANRLSTSGSVGLATGGPTLFTFDLAGEGGPTEEARLELDWSPLMPTVDGELGAVLSYGAGAVLIDLTSLENPVILDTIPVNGANVEELEIAGNLLAIASHDDLTAGWVELWEVSLSEPPVYLSRIDAGEPIWQIEIVGIRVFLGLDDAVLEVDITDPGSPVAGTSIELDFLSGRVTGMAVAGTELFVTDGYAVGILDISTPGSLLQRGVSASGLWAEWLTSEGEVVVGGANGGYLWILESPTVGSQIPVLDLSPRVWGHRGGIVGNTLYQAHGHNLTRLDLSCTPPAADFTWYQMGTQVRFIDRTTFDDWGDDRSWTWSTDHDPTTYHSRGSRIDFGEYGSYQVTMEAVIETGIVSVTKTVEVSEQIAATVIFADGFERGGTCLWSSSES